MHLINLYLQNKRRLTTLSCVIAQSTAPNPSLEETWENKSNLLWQLISKHGPQQTSPAGIPVCSHNEHELALLLALTDRIEEECFCASSRHKT